MLSRTFRLLDPWAGFEEVFGSLAARHETDSCGCGFPALNFHSEGDDGVVTAELPGVDPGDLEIQVVGRKLTISGERKIPEHGNDESFHRSERWHGKFERSIELPYNVESGKVEARVHNGVLAVTLPRAEADKPRKVAISLN